MERFRGQAGATTSEYVGLVMMVAVVVGALVVNDPAGLGEAVSDTIRGAFCRVVTAVGGEESCPEGREAPDRLAEEPDEPAPPICLTSASIHDARMTVDWIFDRSVEGERYAVSETSEGDLVIVDTQYEGSGKTAGLGVDIPLGAKSKLGISASGSVVGLEETGRKFVLEAGEARQAYEEFITAVARDLYMHRSQYLDRLLDADTAEEFLEYLRALDLRDRAIEAMLEDHATHDYHRSRGEATLNLGLSKGIWGAEMTVGGSIGTVLTVDRESGSYSLSFELDAESAAGVGAGVLGVGTDATRGQGGRVSVTLEYGLDNKLTNISATTTLTASAAGSVGIDPGSIPASPDGVGGQLGVSLSGAGVVEATFALPVGEDPVAQQEVATFLEDPVRHIGGFIEVASANGEVIVQGYQARETTERVDLGLRLLASAGYSQIGSHRQLTLVDAVSYDPVHGLMRRRDCLR